MAEPAELRNRVSSAEAPRKSQRLAGGLLVLAWIVLVVGAFLPGVKFFNSSIAAWIYLAIPFMAFGKDMDSASDVADFLLYVPPILSAELCIAYTLLLPTEGTLRRLKRFAWTLLLIWMPLIGLVAKEREVLNDLYYGIYVVCSAFTLAFIALRIWPTPARAMAWHLDRNAIPTKPLAKTTHVFVYGTLKTGHENHARYCKRMVSSVPACVRGRLYLLGKRGYPILVVPRSLIIADATSDFADDRLKEVRERSKGPPSVTNDDPSVGNEVEWSRIEGEVLTFDDARERLPILDSLETFRPDGSGEYMRCLIWTDPPNPQLAWIYVAPPGWVPDETCRLIDHFPAD